MKKDYKYRWWNKPRFKKYFIYAKIEDDAIYLADSEKSISIKDIEELSMETKQVKLGLTAIFTHFWHVKTKDSSYELVADMTGYRKDVREIYNYLKEKNPEIKLNDNGKLFRQYKIYDRTVRKNFGVADFEASARGKALDNTVGFIAIFFWVAFIIGFKILIDRIPYDLLVYNQDLKAIVTVISGAAFGLILVNEVFSPFVGAYMGKKFSLICFLVGLLILVFAI